MVNLTLENIMYAEGILLPFGIHFDEVERLPFIKRFDTIDVQAVPGSGKTTALLAKLLLIEKSLPFNDGSGVLVLSHSNSAVHKIEKEIKKYCPKLFSYPNHIGTIQSFVDKYLAIPYYKSCFNRAPNLVEPNYYKNRLDKIFTINTFKIKNENELLFKKLWRIRKTYNPFDEMRLRCVDGKIHLTDSILGDRIEFCKPTPSAKNYTDYTKAEKDEIYNWALKLKTDVLEKGGILNYEDAYFFADRLLWKAPIIISYLQSRFKYVFIDEMQDMQSHEIEMLEKIFFNGDKLRCFQRIGDVNQTIYNNDDFSENSVWNLELRESIALSGTHRLCSTTASIVEKFGLKYTPIDSLKNWSKEPPKLILFKKENIDNVLPFFSSIVENHKLKFPNLYDGKYPIKAIGWRRDNDKGTCIKSYFRPYQDLSKNPINKPCLWNEIISSLTICKETAFSLRFIKKGILKAFIRILYEENYKSHLIISTPEKFSKFLELYHGAFYNSMNSEIYHWSLKLLDNKHEEVHKEIKVFITDQLLPLFELTYKNSKSYCEDKDLLQASTNLKQNIFKNENSEIEIEIGTVHSAKGETHLATLYLETYFHNDGNKGISYESQRLKEQLGGQQINPNKSKKRTIQSAKMLYVGLSRPKYLLCYAADVENFSEETLDKMIRLGWEIRKELI